MLNQSDASYHTFSFNISIMPMGFVPVGQICNCSPPVGFALTHVTQGLMLTADMGPESFNFPKRYAFGTGNVHFFCSEPQ